VSELAQEAAPLLDAVARMLNRERTPFSLPGHKQGRGADPRMLAVLGERVFRCDVALDGAIDDRTGSHGYDAQAEELAAAAMGADHVLLSTNGSSLSLQVAIMTVAAPGETIIMARNLHKSNLHALVLGGANPAFVEPLFDEDWSISHSVTPDALERAFHEHPDARAAVVVSPTFYGVVADIASLSAVCHKHGVPLITDDAWGAHFLFHPELPEAAMASGTDITVSSLHKAGAGLMQGSVIAVKGPRVDVVRLKHTLSLMESSSTSMLILAALDGARRHLAVDGETTLGKALALAHDARRRITAIPGLRVMGEELAGAPGVFDLDPTKILVDVSDLGISGYTASDWLLERHSLACELADHRHLLVIVTLGDDEETISRLQSALTDLAQSAAALPQRSVPIPPSGSLSTRLGMPPREAFFSTRRAVPLSEAVGKVSAEPVVPYPPGIPAIIPGEIWTTEIAEYLQAGVEMGMHLTDVADPKLATVLVVDGDG
jgi:arginine decarboxylase